MGKQISGVVASWSPRDERLDRPDRDSARAVYASASVLGLGRDVDSPYIVVLHTAEKSDIKASSASS